MFSNMLTCLFVCVCIFAVFDGTTAGIPAPRATASLTATIPVADATVTGDATVSGDAAVSGTVGTASGTVDTVSDTIGTASGTVDTVSGTVGTVSGDVSAPGTVSGGATVSGDATAPKVVSDDGSSSTSSRTVSKTVKLSTGGTKTASASVTMSGSKVLDYNSEFESALSDDQMNMLSYRSAASGERALRFTSDDVSTEVRFTLCARSGDESGSIKFRVQDIIFSNDGPSDRLNLSLNGQPLGYYDTGDDAQFGQAWNVFKNTGTIGNVRTLRNGDHTLSVRVETDRWGVELDKLSVRVKGQAENQAFLCKSIVV